MCFCLCCCCRLLQRRFIRLYGTFSSRAAALYTRGFAAVLLLQCLLGLQSLYDLFKRHRMQQQRKMKQVVVAAAANTSSSSSSSGKEEGAAAAAAETAARQDQASSSSSSSSSLICLFCQSFCVVPTAAACGHIYCWGCIAKWSQQQQQQQGTTTCPVCR